MTDRDRVYAALKAANEQAMRNSNLGQIDAYRINHLIWLIERVREEERMRAAAIARARAGGEPDGTCCISVADAIEKATA